MPTQCRHLLTAGRPPDHVIWY